MYRKTWSKLNIPFMLFFLNSSQKVTLKSLKAWNNLQNTNNLQNGIYLFKTHFLTIYSSWNHSVALKILLKGPTEFHMKYLSFGSVNFICRLHKIPLTKDENTRITLHLCSLHINKILNDHVPEGGKKPEQQQFRISSRNRRCWLLKLSQ